MVKNSLIEGLNIRSSKDSDLQSLSKIVKKSAPAKNFKSNSIQDKIELMKVSVMKSLQKYTDKIAVIRTRQELDDYIDRVLENNILAIDTETTGLNCFTDVIVGFSMYTPGQKAVYIPLLHESYITGQLLDNQCTYKDATECLGRIAHIPAIMHNYKYDMKMMHHNFGVYFSNHYWDTMICAKLLNNKEEAGLKEQHALHFEGGKATYSFSALFQGIPFKRVPINMAMYYAAVDSLVTFELYELQKERLQKFKGIESVFKNIEMPLIKAVAEMEDYGIEIDVDYANKLAIEYHQKAEEVQKKVYAELDKYEDKINSYRIRNPKSKLDNPINLNSPAQLATIIYDVLGVGVVDKQKPRGTGEEILAKIKLPFCKALLEHRGIEKLLNTYIDKLPKEINRKTGRIHASFNQTGADTGRFSSSDPNLQNIPSHDEKIRRMFKAKDGYIQISCDFSQQEPRLLAHYSQDENMIKGYADKRDVYALIAAQAFNTTYENCLEKTSPEAKKRRTQIKSVLLGIMYGRSAPSIGEQLNISGKEAQAIIDKFYSSYPKVKNFVNKAISESKQTGYTETVWGRRRYLNHISLPKYEFEYIGTAPKNFDPLAFDQVSEIDYEVSQEDKDYWTKQLDKCWGHKDKLAIKEKASMHGLKIKDNSYNIQEAERQVVNSKIQGAAADMSKIAMILINDSQELKELGFHMQLAVHDELIGECPLENAKRCGELLSELMIKSSEKEVSVPMKCDCTFTKCWYGEEIEV